MGLCKGYCDQLQSTRLTDVVALHYAQFGLYGPRKRWCKRCSTTFEFAEAAALRKTCPCCGTPMRQRARIRKHNLRGRKVARL